MLRKLLVVVPALAMVAVTVGSASATTAPAAAAPRAACTADTPEVKALTTSMADFMSAIVATPPDTAKVQGIVGDMINELVALQKAGCLPPAAAPAPARLQDPQACLNDLQSMGSALFGLLAAVLKAPPDPTGITTATTAIGAAITKFNNDNCLPIKLPVPGAGGLPAPPGGVPAPPGGLPAPPGLPGT
ncbi:hypothetical protein [Kutzneria sp. NPDC051319]|uniref:hypothetical protein n=1 Tax=Kutzneria sp. NPDC051319 TaxID=3155047 RepID=UPI003422849A